MIETRVYNLDPAELDGRIKKAVIEALREMGITGKSSFASMSEEDELIGTKEACKILGCVPKTMASYRSRKLFRVVMRGPKKALYYKSEILAFRDANTRPSRDMKRK